MSIKTALGNCVMTVGVAVAATGAGCGYRAADVYAAQVKAAEAIHAPVPVAPVETTTIPGAMVIGGILATAVGAKVRRDAQNQATTLSHRREVIREASRGGGTLSGDHGNSV